MALQLLAKRPAPRTSMNLSALDVNLVVALDALLRERSVTLAAKRIGLSQPAMSNQLTRLRAMLNDPLLVRVGRKMALTPRAEQMSARVATIMKELDALFQIAVCPFDPGTTTQGFRIAASDYAEYVIVPRMHAVLVKEAQHATLHVVPLVHQDILVSLRTREVDLAMGIFPEKTALQGMRSHVLFRDSFVALSRLDHPKAHDALKLQDYAMLSHIACPPTDSIEALLQQKGLHRRVSMTVTNCFMTPSLVATSDHVVTLLEHLARALTSTWKLRIFDPGFGLAPVEISMLWHPRTDEEPAQKWLRQIILNVSKEIAATERSRNQSIQAKGH